MVLQDGEWRMSDGAAKLWRWRQREGNAEWRPFLSSLATEYYGGTHIGNIYLSLPAIVRCPICGTRNVVPVVPDELIEPPWLTGAQAQQHNPFSN